MLGIKLKPASKMDHNCHLNIFRHHSLQSVKENSEGSASDKSPPFDDKFVFVVILRGTTVP